MNSSDTVSKPTHEQIALRAELLWKAKGSPSGQDEQIWHEAERQLYDEAKEVFSNSASSTPASGASSSPTGSSGGTQSQRSAPSVASEKMSGKTTPSKSSSRKK